MSAGQSAQLGLLEALAARDSQGIATAAEQFLGANELRDDELRKLPLKAALLGNLGAGKHARAKAIAKRLLPPADPDSDDVELQLLRALSLRRAG